MIKKIVFLIVAVGCTLLGIAQDFRCQVTVNSSKVSGSNKTRFETLQQELYRFVNERKWCLYNLTNEEKIEANIMIVLDDIGMSEQMKGKIVLQVQRSTFKASYKSPLLNYEDKDIIFYYKEGDPLDYADNMNLNGLTSLIAFYLNLFLGVQFDSFAPSGGNPYFSKCQAIVAAAQSSKEAGWLAEGSSSRSNRYWIAEYFSNGQYNEIHEFYYKYHRLGLDVMSESAEKGRTAILESLQLLQKLNTKRPGLVIIQLICQAKQEEIINIFSEATQLEKNTVLNIVKQLDPSNQSKYQRIMQSK